jgi:hypothetical protein
MAVALKEWAVICDALADGSTALLLRKGGIREGQGGFAVEHRAFFLYPTNFHQDPEQLVPAAQDRLAMIPAPPAGSVPIALWAEVEAAWRVEALEPLERLAGLHLLAPATVEARFRYRDRPWLDVLLVRACTLERVQQIAERPEYAGCRSWVPLVEEIAPQECKSVLSEARLAELHRQVCGLLAG